MRPIKFRVWNKATSTMHYCDLHELADRMDLPEMIPLEFTGLLDKNGKEIYGGDVVRWLGYEVREGLQARPPRLIIVGQGYFPPVPESWHGIDYITDCYHLQNLIGHSDKSVEVIGNIYEHPELTE